MERHFFSGEETTELLPNYIYKDRKTREKKGLIKIPKMLGSAWWSSSFLWFHGRPTSPFFFSFGLLFTHIYLDHHDDNDDVAVSTF